jgi:hypothetical protein
MIFENEQSRSALAFWCKEVAKLKPGEYLEVDDRDLHDIASYEHNEACFTPPDRILGNIMSSAYTHSYVRMPNGRVRFARHENTGARRHGDPDDAFRLARFTEREKMRTSAQNASDL